MKKNGYKNWGVGHTWEARALSRGPHHHFFGYYGICPWDESRRYHLALETDFHERPPTPEDVAQVGLINAADGEFLPLARTRAFNLQQGAMLHWINAGHGEELTYNDWQDYRIVSLALHVDSSTTRTLEAAIAAVSPDRRTAIGLDFKRMYRCRTVVGYAHYHNDAPVQTRPEDDGLFRIDLATGEARLLLSVAQVCRHEPKAPREGIAWLDHVCFSPGGRRLMFMCRITRPGGWYSSLWTVDTDGSNLECQIGYEHWISHFAWHDNQRLLISTDVLGQRGFVSFHDRQRDYVPFFPDVLPQDGHACFSPDGRLLVCDRHLAGPPREAAILSLEIATGYAHSLGHYDAPPHFQGDIRCDLHPRFDQTGSVVSFDSIHEGSRQIYLIEL